MFYDIFLYNSNFFIYTGTMLNKSFVNIYNSHLDINKNNYSVLYGECKIERKMAKLIDLSQNGMLVKITPKVLIK